MRAPFRDPADIGPPSGFTFLLPRRKCSVVECEGLAYFRDNIDLFGVCKRNKPMPTLQNLRGCGFRRYRRSVVMDHFRFAATFFAALANAAFLAVLPPFFRARLIFFP